MNYFVQQFWVFQQVCVQHPPFRETALQQSWSLLILRISAKFPFAVYYFFQEFNFFVGCCRLWRHFSFCRIPGFPEFIYLALASGLPQCHSFLYHLVALWTLWNFYSGCNNIRSKVWPQIGKNLCWRRTLAASALFWREFTTELFPGSKWLE